MERVGGGEKQLEDCTVSNALGTWFFSVAGALLAIPVGIKKKSLAPLVFFGTTGTMLDIIMGISQCEREHAERQMKLLEEQKLTSDASAESGSSDSFILCKPTTLSSAPSTLLPSIDAASPAIVPAAHALCLPAAQFGVEEDNVTNSCGLTPAQASSDLPDLKSLSNPDAAVRAYLAGIGITQKDVAAAVSMDPRFLCSSVDETLAPRIAELRRAGLSTPEISRLISVVPNDVFVEPDWIPRLAYCRSLLGSYDRVHGALRRSTFLLTQDIECVVKANVKFLRKSGLTRSVIAEVVSFHPRMLALKPERFMEIIGLAKMLGVPRDSVKFRYILASIIDISPGTSVQGWIS
nr:unnamed protein product [Digitaria exilis]